VAPHVAHPAQLRIILIVAHRSRHLAADDEARDEANRESGDPRVGIVVVRCALQ
jgi:hypothetical protein